MKWIISVGLAAALPAAHAAASKKGDAADLLFRDPVIRTLRIDIPPDGLAALKLGNRDYVRATLSEGSLVLRDVGIRLKGHSTFQPVDKKPAFAIKVNDVVAGQEYHGLSKVMLNNSAQDASYLREVLAAQLFRDAGIPTARATHARVLFNGRDLGLYVLTEGMNKSFLKREFGGAGGNLYEGETKDIDVKLDQESGDDTTQMDLQTLAAAARAPASERMQKLRGLLDVDEFTSFIAMEMLTSSIDGYTFRKNNYRVYHQPKTDRLAFLPHGLDATFGSAGFEPKQDSLLVKALWELPEFQKQYRARLGELAAKVWQVPVLTNRVSTLAAKLVAATPNPTAARQIEEEARKLRFQIVQQEQLVAAELKRTWK